MWLLSLACTGPDLPENSWPRADEVPRDLGGTGHAVGDVMPQTVGVDQFGDDVDLRQFYGSVVVVDLIAGWCGVCARTAGDGQALHDGLQDEGLIWVSVLLEDGLGLRATSQDAADWADAFDLTHPVLASSDPELEAFIQEGFPTVVLVGRDHTIQDPDLWPVDPAVLQRAVR